MAALRGDDAALRPGGSQAPAYGEKADYYVVAGSEPMNWPITLERERSGTGCWPWPPAYSDLPDARGWYSANRGIPTSAASCWRTGGHAAPCARRRKAGEELLTLAGVALAAADETKHFKLLGTTGTGKSTAMHELLGAAIERGDRAVFADADGSYLGRFHDRYRGDIV